jgi:hypothetical protein
MDARTRPEPARRGETKVRVLVVFEDARGVYGKAITRAMAELRPAIDVRRAPLAEIGRDLRGFDPHVAVCRETDGGSPAGGGLGAGAHRPRAACPALPGGGALGYGRPYAKRDTCRHRRDGQAPARKVPGREVLRAPYPYSPYVLES